MSSSRGRKLRAMSEKLNHIIAVITCILTVIVLIGIAMGLHYIESYIFWIAKP